MKKFILSTTILLVLLLGAAIFLPYLFKDKIIETVRTEANKNLRAKLDFNPNIGISIVKSFPNLHLSFKDISVVYQDSVFANDTLFAVAKLELSFDLMQFYKVQQYIYKSIRLDAPFIHIETLNDSTSNLDVLASKDTSESGSNDILNFELSEVVIENGTFDYLDAASNIDIQLHGVEHISSGSFSTQSFVLDAETTIAELLVISDDIAYLNKWKLSQGGTIALDLANSKYALPENKLTINGLEADLGGFIQLLENDIIFNLDISTKNPNLNEFLTLIPAIYTSDFAAMQTKGTAKMNATFKGVYNETSFPAYDLTLQIDRGYFKYPDLPLPMKDIDLDLHVYSKDGNTDHTVIDLQKMHFKMENDPFDLKLNLQDIVGNTLLEADAQGKLDLTNLNKIIPLDGTEISGVLDADIKIKGRVNDITASSIDKFTSNGTVNAQNLVYKTTDMSEPLDVKNAKIVVRNQMVNIPVMDGTIGKNDINFSGKFDNFFAYLLDDKTLTGSAFLASKNLNVNDFMTEAASDRETVELSLVEIPGDVKLDLTASIDKLQYDDLELTNFNGRIGVENSTLQLQDITTDLLGGRVNLKGAYTYDITKPLANFDISYSDIKVADLLAKFKVVRAFAPIADQIQAMTTAKITMATDLNNDMSPKLESINLGGSLNLENITVEKLDVLKGIDTQLGTNHFNVQKLSDCLLAFRIKDGKLFVSPFDMFIDSSKLSIDGISKLDGSIDYKGILSIPSTYIKNETSIVNGLTAGTRFGNLQINPKDFLDLAINIVGTFKKPDVKLNLKEIKSSVKQNIKSTVSNEVSKRKEEAKVRATDEINKIKDATKKRADEAKAKLEAEIALKKKEAEQRIKEEADKQKQNLKKQAEDKLKGLFKK